jgi:hypothetical protein
MDNSLAKNEDGSEKVASIAIMSKEECLSAAFDAGAAVVHNSTRHHGPVVDGRLSVRQHHVRHDLLYVSQCPRKASQPADKMNSWD